MQVKSGNVQKGNKRTIVVCSLISLFIAFVLYICSVRSALTAYYDASHQINHDTNNPSIQLQLLSSLQQLTNSWYSHLTQPYFLQQKIFELTKRHQYHQVISSSKRAIRLEQFKHKFSIWYHKAIAECLLQRYEACKQSYEQALLLKDADGTPYLQYIFNILHSNGMIKRSLNPKANFNSTIHKQVINQFIDI